MVNDINFSNQREIESNTVDDRRLLALHLAAPVNLDQRVVVDAMMQYVRLRKKILILKHFQTK